MLFGVAADSSFKAQIPTDSTAKIMSVAYQRSCEAMGTRFEVTLHGSDEQHLEAVAVAVCEEIQRLDGVLSRFNPSSEIARLNRQAVAKPVRVEREVFALLERCEQARHLTEGFFDVTALSGGNGLALEPEHCTVRFTRADAAIDLGAIGKGYALDCGGALLHRFGVRRGLLQGGTSSVLALGADAWQVAVRHPLKPEEIAQHLELENRGLSCSAVRHPGQVESDVVNPHSGEPLGGHDACVVLAENATAAEIFSTALLAMGRAKAACYQQDKTWADWQVFWL